MNQYLITAYDGTHENALDNRMNVRPYHLEGVKKMKENGNFILGGAILNDGSSARLACCRLNNSGHH